MITIAAERSGLAGRALLAGRRAGRVLVRLSRLPEHGAARPAAGHRILPTWMRAVTSTSTTPARACRPRRSWPRMPSGSRGRCFGNPHSAHPASAASTDLIEQTRLAVLAHFNAPPEEYAAIFTPNATGACRLVGEAYPFGPRTRLVLTWDNHNSVNGIREFAAARGAVTRYVPFGSPELRVDDDADRPGAGPARAAAAGCSPTRRRATSAGCGIRWPGSRWPMSTATTSCWTRRRTCRRAGWTCPWSSPISWRSAGTRCSATRPASAA